MMEVKDETPKPVNPAVAVFAFVGWLTMREEACGPFSVNHDATPLARLAGEYCRAQGWATNDDAWLSINVPVQ